MANLINAIQCKITILESQWLEIYFQYDSRVVIYEGRAFIRLVVSARVEIYFTWIWTEILSTSFKDRALARRRTKDSKSISVSIRFDRNFDKISIDSFSAETFSYSSFDTWNQYCKTFFAIDTYVMMIQRQIWRLNHRTIMFCVIFASWFETQYEFAIK